MLKLYFFVINYRHFFFLFKQYRNISQIDQTSLLKFEKKEILILNTVQKYFSFYENNNTSFQFKKNLFTPFFELVPNPPNLFIKYLLANGIS